MKRTLTQLMFLLVFVLGASSTYAQRTVSGKVTDGKTGDPLIGANILVKGTSNGTITDLDGMYSLSVAEGSTLVFSYTGYANQEVVVGTSGNIDISLAEGSVLDEVVIVGYGSQKKRDVTGSVASLKEKDFNQGIVTSADQLLQNRVAGVNISLTTAVSREVRQLLRSGVTTLSELVPIHCTLLMVCHWTVVPPKQAYWQLTLELLQVQIH
jgi:hypothetical protein